MATIGEGKSPDESPGGTNTDSVNLTVPSINNDRSSFEDPNVSKYFPGRAVTQTQEEEPVQSAFSDPEVLKYFPGKNTENQVKGANFVAKDKSPDQHAEVIKIADKFNIGTDFAERKLDHFKNQDERADQDFRFLADDTPGLARFLTNPDNYAVAKDDLEVLGNIEKESRGFISNAFGSENGILPMLMGPFWVPAAIGALAANQISKIPKVKQIASEYKASYDVGQESMNITSAIGLLASGRIDENVAASMVATSNQNKSKKRLRQPLEVKLASEILQREGGDVNDTVREWIRMRPENDGHIFKGAIENLNDGSVTLGEFVDQIGTTLWNEPYGTSHLFVENIPTMIPSLISRGVVSVGSAALSPAGANPLTFSIASGLAFFASGFLSQGFVEFGLQAESILQEKGYKTSNRDDLLRAFRDKPLMKEVYAEAGRFAVVNSAIENAFNVVAGKKLAKVKTDPKLTRISNLTGKTIRLKPKKLDLGAAIVFEQLEQGFGGASGQTVGDIVAKKSLDVDYGQAGPEFLLDMVSSPGEAFMGAFRRGAFGPEPDIDTLPQRMNLVKDGVLNSNPLLSWNQNIRESQSVTKKTYQALMAVKSAKDLQGIGNLIGESKLARRQLPEKIKEMIGQATENNPDAKVWFNTEDLEGFFKSSGLNIQQELDEMTEDGFSVYSTGKELGLPAIGINLADFISSTAMKDYYGDIIHIAKAQENGPMAIEGLRFLESVPVELNRIAGNEKILNDSAVEIRTDVLRQFNDAGVTGQQAEVFADLTSRFFRTQGENLSINPTQLFRQVGLKRVLQEGVNLTPERVMEISLKAQQVFDKEADRIEREGIQDDSIREETTVRTEPVIETETRPIQAQSQEDLSRLFVDLDIIRQGKIPAAKKPKGKSLVQFIRSKGGIAPDSVNISDLKAIGINNIIRKKGISLDRARELAEESGFLPQGGTINTLLRAMDGESRGFPVFPASAFEGTVDANQKREGLLEFERDLQKKGINVNDLTNEEIADRLSEIGILFSIRDQAIPNAFYDINSKEIGILKGANFLSLLEEMSHHFMVVMEQLSNQEGSTEQLKSDMNVLREFVGAKPGAAISRKQHEKLARATMIFTLEGKAPSEALKRAFDRFQQWILKILKHFDTMGVRLTPEVRNILGRMFAANQEISNMELEHDIYAPFTTGTPFQAKGKTADRITNMARQARVDTMNRLTIELLKDSKKDRDKFLKKERAKIRAEIEPIVRNSKEYRAKAELRKGGIDPDFLADALGFSSEGEMISAVDRLPTIKQAINNAVTAKMIEVHGEPLTDGPLSVKALDAMHNPSSSKFLRMQLDYIVSDELSTFKEVIRRVTKKPRSDAEINSAADEVIGNTTHVNLKPYSYQLAEDAARRKAGEAAAKGDIEAASKFKEQELVAHVLYKMAREKQERAGVIFRFMRKQESKDNQSRLNKAGEQYLDRMNELLDNHEFRQVPLKQIKKRESVRDFVKRMEAESRPHAIPRSVLNEANLVNWKLLTVKELEDVFTAAQSINHLANFKNKLILGKETRDFDTAVNETVEGILKHAKDLSKRTTRDKSSVEKFGDEVKTLLMQPETILNELDGFVDLGPVYMNIKGIIDIAVARDLVPEKEKSTEAILEIYKKHYTPKEMRALNKKIFIKEIGVSLTKEEILGIGSNRGNTGNWTAIKIADGLWGPGKGVPTTEQLNAVLRHIQPKDWDFIQDFWNYGQTFWAQIQETNRLRTGVRLKKVEAVPFVTEDGKQMAGGYYTLRYDSDRSAKSSTNMDEDFDSMRSGRTGKTRTTQHFREARVGSGSMVPRLDLGVFHQHIRDVVTDLAIGDAVVYSARILNDPRVGKVFEVTDKLWALDSLKVWLKDVAVGEIVSSDRLSKISRAMRIGFTSSVLKTNVRTAIVQLTGSAQTMASLGPVDTVTGLKELFTTMPIGKKSLTNQINEKSDLMPIRSKVWSKDISEHKKFSDKLLSFLPEGLRSSGYYMIIKMQGIIDRMSWIGAFSKAKKEFKGDTKKAALSADRFVSRVQGSGLWSDRTALERGTLSMNQRQIEAVKTLTTLASYMLAKANVAYRLTKQTDFSPNIKNVPGVFKWSANMVLLFLVEELIIAALVGNFPSDEDKNPDSMYWFVTKLMLESLGGTIPIVREFSSEIRGFHGGGVIGTGAKRTNALIKELGDFVMDSYDQEELAEVDAQMFKAVNDFTAMFFTRHGSTQLNRIVDALYRSNDGEDVRFRDPIVGKPFKK